MIPLNTKGRAEFVVSREKTALAVGSGDLLVLATPVMISLMEQAAAESVKPFLGEGESSVGVRLEVSHVSATPVGQRVRAESEVAACDGRRITFSVRAFDEKGLIGEGVHIRAVVNAGRFMEKCASR